MSEILGTGSAVVKMGEASGTLRRFVTPDDVIDVLDEGDDAAAGIVALVEDAGATFLAPIEADLAGILCRHGDIESHLAIVSRDFGIAALMGFAFADASAEPEDGVALVIDTDAGTIRLANDQETSA